MDTSPTTLQTIISIATGMEGLERGIQYAGTPLKIAAYVEIEAFIEANLVAKMETLQMGEAPVWSDVKTFPAKPFHRKIHGITAGYPCQPFSHAGQRKGTSDPRHIFPHILGIIKSVEPIWCFFENVEGHLTLGYGEVYRSLRNLGYTVEAGIFSAEEVGAPHRRKRLFILAVLGDTFGNGLSGRHKGKRGQNGESRKRRVQQFKGTSSELGNPKHNGQPTEPKQGSHEGTCNKRGPKKPKTPGQPSGTDRPPDVRGIHRSNGGSKPGDMANTSGERSKTGLSKQGQRKERQSEKPNNSCNRWPSRPGQPQHPWEEPRTIEPGMGFTIDGYNYRTDLLRMAGNGVVYQTAAMAWQTLWQKMKNNFK